MDITKKYHDKKWTLQFLDTLYNSIDMREDMVFYLEAHKGPLSRTEFLSRSISTFIESFPPVACTRAAQKSSGSWLNSGSS
jgi:hypothetical protein